METTQIVVNTQSKQKTGRNVDEPISILTIVTTE
jgi:hypothetical protein